ncbi:nitroreductase family protein [Azoarcus sp. CIB]|uniref:nitroreductase family protein n=1 Tax=Aromatoleum sp. (strain CIB) TaxID=198107 RepID=UPI0018DD760B|nr:nitroreductase family protein [Azoarcus sp. CIB]
MESKVLKAYHRIEKGLALRQPRVGFGADAVASLLSDVSDYLDRFGCDATTAAAVNSLVEYQAFNEENGHVDDCFARRLAVLRGRHSGVPDCAVGGTEVVRREDILGHARQDLKHFFNSRYSIRNFSEAEVAPELIAEAVRLAQKSPSVCNRQAARVYSVRDKNRQSALLRLQNGNRGFGEQASVILVVTARIDCFHTVGERYQSWIDGGLFAMSLIYALHSLGLGSCCLNWSVERQQDRRLKEAAGLGMGEEVIMLVAVGHLPEEFRVAQSPRRSLNEVLFEI